LKYGDALVAACAASGTHYVDITGETMFVRHNIDNHNEAAVETGAKVGGCACWCVWLFICLRRGVWSACLPVWVCPVPICVVGVRLCPCLSTGMCMISGSARTVLYFSRVPS
jgi:hypothetical protein